MAEVVEGQTTETVATEPTEDVVAPESTEATPVSLDTGGPAGGELKTKDVDLTARLSQLEEENRLAKHEAELYRRLVENGGRQTPAEVEPGEPDEPFNITDEEVYANPGLAFKKAFEWKDRRDAKVRVKQEQAQNLREAKQAFDSTFQSAMGKNPKLYQGIEKNVAEAMTVAYHQGKIGIRELSDQLTWQATAAVIRNAKGEYDLSKYFPGGTPKPVPSVRTELPKTHMPPKAAMVISDDERALAKTVGLTDEQFLAAKKAIKEEEGR